MDIKLLISAFELGYKSCEAGKNIQQAELDFLKILKDTKK